MNNRMYQFNPYWLGKEPCHQMNMKDFYLSDVLEEVSRPQTAKLMMVIESNGFFFQSFQEASDIILTFQNNVLAKEQTVGKVKFDNQDGIPGWIPVEFRRDAKLVSMALYIENKQYWVSNPEVVEEAFDKWKDSWKGIFPAGRYTNIEVLNFEDVCYAVGIYYSIKNHENGETIGLVQLPDQVSFEIDEWRIPVMISELENRSTGVYFWNDGNTVVISRKPRPKTRVKKYKIKVTRS